MVIFHGFLYVDQAGYGQRLNETVEKNLRRRNRLGVPETMPTDGTSIRWDDYHSRLLNQKYGYPLVN